MSPEAIPHWRACEAVLAVLKGTYTLVDGLRVCLVCKAQQHDFLKGHAPGCAVEAGLQRALDILNDVVPA